MKKLLITTLVALLMVGCGGGGSGSDSPESNESSAETPPTKTPEVAEIDLDDPETRERIAAEAIHYDDFEWKGKEGEELRYAPDQLKPYTGWRKTMHLNGKVASLTQIKDGKLDGLDYTWHRNGRKELIGQYRANMKQGTFIYYLDDGRELGRQTYQDDKTVELKYSD